jgi:DNA-binding beta-propeller fold protein YncE
MKKHSVLPLLMLVAGIAFGQKNSQYEVVRKIPVGGEGGWDYMTVDDNSRLFISHGTEVDVVDATTGNKLGVIPDTKGVHGIALAPEFGKGFISNGRDSSVTVFDLKTLATITKVPVTGKNPDAILYDAFSKRVFAFNGRTQNVTVINASDNKVVGTIPVDGKPEFAATNLNGKVYVNIEDKNKISVINSSTLKVEQNWPISPGEGASGLAMDISKHYLFTVCDNKMMVILNAETGKVITTVPIGEGPDAAAFDPILKRAYSSNGEGTLTVVQEDEQGGFKVLDNVKTMKGARTMGVDLKTHHVFLPAAEFGEKPQATADNPHPRPSIKSGTFVIVEVAPK